MASFTDRIKILLEIDDTGGVKSLKRFGDNVKEADGITGKFKAAAGGSMDYVKEHAGAFAVSAGTALVAFGISAVHAFEDTAKAAIDGAAATGLATEDFSRWIAVGDDFGVTAEQLQSGIGKIAKGLNDTKWEKYGIATHDAAGNARDANEVLIDSLAKLGSITNATERARVGNELFGKGYASLAPLVGKTRDEYEKLLGTVEDGQVITEEEAEKAERMRKAEDALADALKEVQLMVGQAVAGLAPYIENLSKIIGLLSKIPHLQDLAFGGMPTDVGNATDAMMDMVAAAIASGDAIKYLTDRGFNVAGATGALEDYEAMLAATKPTAEDAAAATDKMATATEDARDEAIAHNRVMSENITTEGQLKAATKATTDAYADSVAEIKERIKSEQELREEILSSIDAEYAYAQQVRDTNAELAAYNEEVAGGALSGDALATATESARLSMVDAATAYATAKGAAKGSKEEVDLVIESLYNQAAALDPSSPLFKAITGYITQLNNIPSEISTRISVTGPATVTIDGTDRNARNVQEGRGFDIGESGAGAVFTPGSGGGNTYVTVNTSADPQAVVQALQQYSRQNGNGAVKNALGI